MLSFCLIGIGVVLIIASYLIFDKMDQKKENMYGKESNQSDYIQEEEEKIRLRMEHILNETMEELSKVSNEKIIAFSDYSEQVFEKIAKNHNEAVFLYDMLMSKDAEVKEMLSLVEQNKKTINDVLVQVKVQLEQETIAYEKLIKLAKQKQKRNDEPVSKQNEKIDTQTVLAKAEPVLLSSKTPEENNEPEGRTESHSIDKDQILNLHKEGRSIIDISKMLSLGQGEVKLVIDLFQGAKR